MSKAAELRTYFSALYKGYSQLNGLKVREGKQRGEMEVKRNLKVNKKCNARWKRREITYKKYTSRRRENIGKGTGRRREGECKRGAITEEAEKKKMAKKTEGKLFEYEEN